MARQILRVFVSSRMKELAPERAAIGAALAELNVETFLFERDAGARPQSIQETYLEELEACDLYVGVFWKGFGAYTIEEYEHARTLGMDCLIYEKRADLSSDRDPALQAFMARLGDVLSGLTVAWFTTAEELATLIKGDVASWQAKIVHGAAAPTAQAIYFGVPSKPPADLVGRRTEIEQLVRCLQSGHDVAVEGLPGVGKTTLALAVAHHPGVRRFFKDGVLWAALGPKADVANALAGWAEALVRHGLLHEDIARIPALSERMQVVKDALGARRLLLAIDDVWEQDAAMELRCGGVHCGHLITTRDKAIARAFAGVERASALGSLPDSQALELLSKLAPETCAADPETARDLVRSVGGSPQAVRLIGGYLANATTGLFGNTFGDLHTEAVRAMGDPGKRMKLAVQRLGARGGKKTTFEKTIALSLDGLPREVKAAFYRLGAFAAKPDRFSPEAATTVTLASGGALATLAGRNLIEVDPASQRLSVHPTVADVARARLAPADVERHRAYYLDVLRTSGENWQRVEDAYGQIRWAWAQAPDGEPLGLLFVATAPFHARRGLAAEATAWAERCLRLTESSNDAAGTAWLLNKIADAQERMGYLDRALELDRRALTLWESLNNIPWQIEILQSIGLRLGGASGQPDAGIEQLQKALALAESAGNRGKYAEILICIANVQRRCSMTASARDTIERALPIYRELGNQAGEADALAMLAAIYRDLNQPDRAFGSLKPALAIAERLGNPQLIADGQMLAASIYRDQGRLQEALAAAQGALQGIEATGDLSLKTDCLSLLANVLDVLERPQEALSFLHQVLAINEETGSKAGQATTLNRMGHLHRKEGLLEEALEAHRRALAINEAIAHRPGQADTLDDLNRLYDDLTEPRERLGFLSKAVSIWRELGHRERLARSLGSIGWLYMRLAEHEAALAAFGEAVALFRALDDRGTLARALYWMSLAHEQIAEVSGPRAESTRRTDLENAVLTASEAVRLDPDNALYRANLETVERKRAGVLRFGASYLTQRPAFFRIAVEISTGLMNGLGEAAVRGKFENEITALRQAIRNTWGVKLPSTGILHSSRVANGSFVISLDDVDLSVWSLVEGDAAAHQLSELSHKQVVEKISRSLASVLTSHLKEFIGHQETMNLLDECDPEAARGFYADSRALTLLVVVLQNLLEERVPIVALPAIARALSRLFEERRGRLDILRAVRMLPEVKARLPGNHAACRFLNLGAAAEAKIAQAIQLDEGGGYLQMEPSETQALLAQARELIEAHPGSAEIALVVKNAAIRRFARKVIELEFPHLSVLSREELMPGLEANFLDHVRAALAD